ncbi:MAG: hypothetical protein COZ18_14245 [Flexibacter sp. CG_4_10_14_3_um_filter_32_15]|nr:MAG: hypothetical protein COZ18_14245 [Flexibacter sp. CG_4_10_14_3_um_filter_32_15]
MCFWFFWILGIGYWELVKLNFKKHYFLLNLSLQKYKIKFVYLNGNFKTLFKKQKVFVNKFCK